MRRVVVFALFVVVGSVGLLAAPPASAAPAAAERVPYRSLPRADVDVEVFMLVDATEREIAAVERRIRASGEVRRYAHLDEHDAYAEFKRIFRDNRDLVESIRPSDLPDSFPVDLERAKDVDAFAQDLRKLPGVDQAEPKPDAFTEADALAVIHTCEVRTGDFEIFMDVGATQTQIDGVMSAVAAVPGLAVIKVLSQQDAYAEFAQIFAEQPDLVAKIRATDLPQSVRVSAADRVPWSTVKRFQQLPGVDSVETPDSACAWIRQYLAEGMAVDDLARFMVQYAGSHVV